MTPDIDIYRTATVIIQAHGEDAELHASLRADALLATGDIDGQITFLKIVDAIRDIQNMEPKSSIH